MKNRLATIRICMPILLTVLLSLMSCKKSNRDLMAPFSDGTTSSDSTSTSSSSASSSWSSTASSSSVSTSSSSSTSTSSSSSSTMTSSSSSSSSGTIDAFSTIQAENYSEMAGIQLENGNTTVGFIDDTDWLRYDNVDFGPGARSLVMNVAKADGSGELEIRIDSPSGTLLGTFTPGITGTWTAFADQGMGITDVSGVHDLYIIAVSPGGGVCNIDWFSFSTQGVPDAPTGLYFTAIGDNTITLNWTDNASDEDGYNVYWSKSSSKPSSPGQVIAQDSTSHMVSGIDSGTIYHFWVESYNSVGISLETYNSQSTTGIPPSGFDVQVMSFNVRVPVDAFPHDWASRRSRVAAVINTYNPDVIGFQEMLDYQRDDVITDTTGYASYGVGRDCGGGEGVFVLYKTSRWTIDPANSGNFWFSSTPTDCNTGAEWDGSYKRMCTYARLVDNSTSDAFYIFNSHWTYIRDWRQENHAELLADKVAARAISDPWVATGDFNTTDVNNAYLYLTHQWDKAGKWTPLTFSDSYFLFNSGVPAGSGTFHGFGGGTGGERIDFILSEQGNYTVQDAVIIRDMVDGYYPSDHFPIMTELRFN